MGEESNWTKIKQDIREKKTKWIYLLNKPALIVVCKEYKVDCSEKDSIDKTRKALATFVKQPLGTSSANEDSDESSGSETKNSVDSKIPAKKPTMSIPGAIIEPFKKGNSWKAFERQLDAFVLLNDVTEEKKSALLITRLSPAVFEELQAVCEPTEPISMSYSQLKAKLTNLYEPKTNEHLQRYSFRERKQKDSETVKDYFVALQGLAQRCKFSAVELKGQLKDQLIAGVRSKTIKYELLKSSDGDVELLLKLAETVEMAETEAGGEKGVFGTNTQTQAKNEKFESSTVNVVRASGHRSRGKFHNKQKSGYGRKQQYSKPGNTSNSNPQSNRGSQTSAPGPSGTQGTECFCCGKAGHRKEDCTLRFKFCSECGEQGHIFKTCPKNKFKRKRENQNFVGMPEESDVSSDDGEPERYSTDFFQQNFIEAPQAQNNTVTKGELKRSSNQCEPTIEVDRRQEKQIINNIRIQPHLEKIKVNNVLLQMEVDTGAAISAISKDCYKKNFSEIKLQPVKTSLRAYNKQPIPTLGYLNVKIEREQVCSAQILYVIEHGGLPIVGRDWLDALKMWPLKFEIKEVVINEVATDLELKARELHEQFPEVFAKGFGKFKNGELTLTLTAEAKPKFFQPRRIPFAIKEMVESEIRRLETNEIISAVKFSEWGTPVVPVLKSPTAVRLCGDYKITINKYLVPDRYPLPRIEGIFDAVRGAAFFTKLDLSVSTIAIVGGIAKIRSHKYAFRLIQIPPVTVWCVYGTRFFPEGDGYLAVGYSRSGCIY